jgi:hypothetical protein
MVMIGEVEKTQRRCRATQPFFEKTLYNDKNNQQNHLLHQSKFFFCWRRNGDTPQQRDAAMERHQNDDKMVGGLGEMKNTAAG